MAVGNVRLIRHGRTAYNAAMRLQGQIDIELDEVGLWQAHTCAEVLAGAKGAREIGDRREAIRSAVAQMTAGDVLVVAGKGHEQGMSIAGVLHPFNDVAEVAQALEMLRG